MTTWSEEGVPLGDIIQWRVGPDLWTYLLEWTGERLPPGPRWGTASDFRIAHDLGPRYRAPADRPDHPYLKAVRACLPFLDAWNDGALIAKARVGGPLEPLTDISPPRASYTLTIRKLLDSIIVDPTTALSSNVKRFYDVRFWPNPARQTADKARGKPKAKRKPPGRRDETAYKWEEVQALYDARRNANRGIAPDRIGIDVRADYLRTHSRAPNERHIRDRCGRVYEKKPTRKRRRKK
jgi:hypothetical protein